MLNMIRITLVSYINTRPFRDGLTASFSSEELALNFQAPADCARSLWNGECDLALIPVGSIPDFPDLRLLKDHCIGAEGPVNSVFLFSQVPVSDVKEIRLDPHSRSSNGLTRVLAREWWKIDPVWTEVKDRDFESIAGPVATVAIGDKAYSYRNSFSYVYDLSEEWKRLTGLPFVFAVWAYRPEGLSGHQRNRIREALHRGVLQAADSALLWGPTYGYTPEEAKDYLLNRIQYFLDAPKHKALAKYLSLLEMVAPAPSPALI